MEKRANHIYEQILKIVECVLGETTTYQTDLQRFGERVFGRKFAGVYASDRIPKLSKEMPYAILNLDASNETGSHWIAAIWTGEEDGIMIYDSFGRKTKKIIPSIFKSGNGRIHMTDPDAEQTIDELNCGARSFAFIILYHFYGHGMAMLI